MLSLVKAEVNNMSASGEKSPGGRNGNIDNDDRFHRIPSESSLNKNNGSTETGVVAKVNKPWERSQSALDLQNNRTIRTASSVDYTEGTCGSSVSEHSKVYWDLSNADDEIISRGSASGGGKFKISLQTIHQKEEMQTSANPGVSFKARVVRRMASETSLLSGGNSPRNLDEISFPTEYSDTLAGSTPSPSSHKTEFRFSFNSGNLTVTLANAVPILQENIDKLKATSVTEQNRALLCMLCMIEEAWATPSIGRDLAYGLCDVLRTDGGLEILLDNCGKSQYREIKLGSAKVLEQTMTVGNRDYVASKGLEIVVEMAKTNKDDIELMKATTGILDSLFKHSEKTCTKAIKYGGLDSILYSCRMDDTAMLRNCAEALANLAMFGGSENQQEMINHRTAEWLFPLAFSDDDSIRYYAFLAITALSANKEIETAVSQSGTLQLVKPFILTHDPADFAKSDLLHIHGQSKEWLTHLVPLLESKVEEAQSLAAFHFAMEAHIKAEQGKREIFHEISAVEPLKRVASGTNRLASKFASQALQIIGESVPFTLSSQVPLWTSTDVKHWLQQSGFGDYTLAFTESYVDGDMILLLTENNLQCDLKMTNGIIRKRFLRELTELKIKTDYSSSDTTQLNDWLHDTSFELTQYTYQMLKAGVDRRILRYLSDDNLRVDCNVQNGVHRMKIMESAKLMPKSTVIIQGMPAVSTPIGYEDGDGPLEKPIDCFISYRRSNGSQLASLLKVHLQLRGFTVFLDIEKLRAGKFDDNLLNSVRNARHFILVLTPCCLDRCMGDTEMKDWVHREVVAAIEGGCNIIPVLDNFQWPTPETLPEDMRSICFFNGIRWIHDYQEACVEKLEKFLTGQMSPGSFRNRPSLSKGSSIGSSSTADIHGSPALRPGGLGSSFERSPDPMSEPWKFNRDQYAHHTPKD